MGDIKIVFNEVQTTGGEGASKNDGATTKVAGDDQFDSASSTFLTDGVQAGDKLVIVGGADAGTYTIAVVDSETQLHISGEFPVGGLTGQTFSVTQYNFNGLRPDASAVIKGPEYGTIAYYDCMGAGLFEFQAGAPWGPDPLDWIRVERILLALDEANMTDIALTVVPPEPSISVPEIPIVRDLTEWDNAGMERLNFLHAPIRLRPGCKIKLTTVGAIGPQLAEVWWERERQIRRDKATGNEVFAYGV